MSDPIIQPRTLSGFRDFLPEAMIPREWLIETARRVYRSYGFAPIDTPALEYSEILCGKGSDETDRQMYRFMHGDKDVAMRFDLTVPLARFVAQHHHDLVMPFKRYHIGTVWRGERPQAGRYREFAQCDFDTIGTTSIASDLETVLVINDLIRAIGFQRFSIRINNRKILNGLLDNSGLLEESVAVLRALDKLPKIGPEKVQQEMLDTTSASLPQVRQVLDFASIEGTNSEILDRLDPICSGNQLARQGLDELTRVINSSSAVGVTDANLRIDVSIARGLDYYTGTIVETFLDDLPSFGSICSGGRYDNLAQLYTKQELPGIGASLGLDRLLAAMQKLEMISTKQTTADVLIVQFSQENLDDYFRLAAELRVAGIAVEVYPDARKLNRQYKYANRQGTKVVIIAGGDELAKGVVQIKMMGDGTQTEVPWTKGAPEIVRWLQERL